MKVLITRKKSSLIYCLERIRLMTNCYPVLSILTLQSVKPTKTMNGDTITLNTIYSDQVALESITGTILRNDHTIFALCQQNQSSLKTHISRS